MSTVSGGHAQAAARSSSSVRKRSRARRPTAAGHLRPFVVVEKHLRREGGSLTQAAAGQREADKRDQVSRARDMAFCGRSGTQIQATATTSVFTR